LTPAPAWIVGACLAIAPASAQEEWSSEPSAFSESDTSGWDSGGTEDVTSQWDRESAAEAQQDAAMRAELERVWSSIDWVDGPTDGELGSVASIRVPTGYLYADADGARRLLKEFGTPSSRQEVGVVTSDAEDSTWFLVFEYADIGYVKDDEKDSLDADAILASIRDATEAANEERARMGTSGIDVLGWDEPPHYNPQTHDLEWCLRGESDGQSVLNFNTRLLGRHGVMSATLVCDPEELPMAKIAVRDLLAGFAYTSGHGYAEFRRGDKVAGVGLAALVAGGGTAAALKTGLLQKLWKLIVAAFLAAGAALKKLFGGGSREAPPMVKLSSTRQPVRSPTSAQAHAATALPVATRAPATAPVSAGAAHAPPARACAASPVGSIPLPPTRPSAPPASPALAGASRAVAAPARAAGPPPLPALPGRERKG
jgi:uncharacterized membrane-anchored protein